MSIPLYRKGGPWRQHTIAARRGMWVAASVELVVIYEYEDDDESIKRRSETERYTVEGPLTGGYDQWWVGDTCLTTGGEPMPYLVELVEGSLHPTPQWVWEGVVYVGDQLWSVGDDNMWSPGVHPGLVKEHWQQLAQRPDVRTWSEYQEHKKRNNND